MSLSEVAQYSSSAASAGLKAKGQRGSFGALESKRRTPSDMLAAKDTYPWKVLARGRTHLCDRLICWLVSLSVAR